MSGEPNPDNDAALMNRMADEAFDLFADRVGAGRGKYFDARQLNLMVGAALTVAARCLAADERPFVLAEAAGRILRAYVAQFVADQCAHDGGTAGAKR